MLAKSAAWWATLGGAERDSAYQAIATKSAREMGTFIYVTGKTDTVAGDASIAG